MAGLDKDVLAQIFSAFPQDQRAAFLEKALDSLDDDTRNQLLARWLSDPIAPPRRERNLPKPMQEIDQAPATVPSQAVHLVQQSAPDSPDQKSRIDAELKKFQFYQEEEQLKAKRRMPLQLLGCAVIGLLLIGLLLGLSVGAKELWDYLQALIGS